MTHSQQLAAQAQKLIGCIQDGGVPTREDMLLIACVEHACRRILEETVDKDLWAGAYYEAYQRVYGEAA